MGTWDEGSFGNDTACDWSYGLEKVNDLRYVETTLDKVLAYGAGEMVPADAAECAVAAAEVIARLKGRWGEEDSYTETTDAGRGGRGAEGARRRLTLPLHPVDRDLLGFPLDLNRVERLDIRGPLQLREERLRNQDLVRPGARAESRRGGHRVADHRVFQPAVRPDVAGEHLPEVDPDPNAELRAALLLPLRLEPLQGLELIERAVHGAIGVVFVRHGRAPQRHDRIAHELVERAAVLEHELHHLGEILGEERGDVVRAHGLRHRREAADIGEENHDRSLFTREPARILLLRDDLRDVGGEVALEVREHQGFAPHLLGALRVLDRHRRERAEGDEALEIVVGER